MVVPEQVTQEQQQHLLKKHVEKVLLRLLLATLYQTGFPLRLQLCFVVKISCRLYWSHSANTNFIFLLSLFLTSMNRPKVSLLGQEIRSKDHIIILLILVFYDNKCGNDCNSTTKPCHELREDHVILLHHQQE